MNYEYRYNIMQCMLVQLMSYKHRSQCVCKIKKREKREIEKNTENDRESDKETTTDRV